MDPFLYVRCKHHKPLEVFKINYANLDVSVGHIDRTSRSARQKRRTVLPHFAILYILTAMKWINIILCEKKILNSDATKVNKSLI